STTRVTAWPGPSSRRRDFASAGPLSQWLYAAMKQAGLAVRPSPYIWSGTNQYVSGKYVRDGVYYPDAVDSQVGFAGLLITMIALDPTITFAGVTITPPNVPSVPKPAIAPVT